MRCSTLVAMIAVVGCGYDSEPATSKTAEPNPADTSNATRLHLGITGGEYVVDLDDGLKGGKSSTTSTNDGKSGARVVHEVSWNDDTRRLSIVNGVLSVDGKSHGAIKRGTRIIVNAAGEVSIREPKP